MDQYGAWRRLVWVYGLKTTQSYRHCILHDNTIKMLCKLDRLRYLHIKEIQHSYKVISFCINIKIWYDDRKVLISYYVQNIKKSKSNLFSSCDIPTWTQIGQKSETPISISSGLNRLESIFSTLDGNLQINLFYKEKYFLSTCLCSLHLIT